MSVDIGWFLVCALATYYVTYVAVYSDIFTPVRNVLGRSMLLMALTSCPHCTSFWSALLVVGLFVLSQYYFIVAWVIAWIGLAGAASLIYAVLDSLEN